jgi:hypothetical protein
MIYYHTTDAADEILRGGFRDATGSYGFATLDLTGVFLGDSPMTINEGATGDQVLRVEIPDDVDLRDFELIEDAKPYREWVRTRRTHQHARDRDADDRPRAGTYGGDDLARLPRSAPLDRGCRLIGRVCYGRGHVFGCAQNVLTACSRRTAATTKILIYL